MEAEGGASDEVGSGEQDEGDGGGGDGGDDRAGEAVCGEGGVYGAVEDAVPGDGEFTSAMDTAYRVAAAVLAVAATLVGVWLRPSR